MTGDVFGTDFAILFSFLEILVFWLVGKFLTRKFPGTITKVILVIVLLITIIGTWYFLLTGGAQESSIDPGIIVGRTAVNIEENIYALANDESIINFYEKDLSALTMDREKSFSFYYTRGETRGLVSVSIRKYNDVLGAKNDFNYDVNEYRDYPHYEDGDFELLLGPAEIQRTADTFYVGGSTRNINTILRADSYIISMMESTDEGQLDDLRTADVLAMLLK